MRRYHNTSSITHMLDHIQWPLLSQGRSCLNRLVFLYKNVNKKPPVTKQIRGFTHMLSCLSYVAQIPPGTVFSQQQHVNGTLCLTI